MSRRFAMLLAAALLFGMNGGLTAPRSERTDDKAARLDAAVDIRREASARNLGLVAMPFAGLATQRIENIVATVDHAADACSRIEALSRRTPQTMELSRLFEVLSHSSLAQELIEQARRRHALVCLDRATSLLGYYRAGLRLIGLKSTLSEAEKLAYLAHELSHVPQHHRYSDNRYYPAPELILLRRIREATAEATATWITWQLYQKGFQEPWRAKLEDHFYGDVAAAFERTWQRVSGPNRDLAAARAAFDQWFSAPSRLNLYDRMTIAHLRRISGDSLGLVPPRKFLTEGFLAGIARVGNRNFLTQVPGRRLTDGHYTGRVSESTASALEVLSRMGRRDADRRPGPT